MDKKTLILHYALEQFAEKGYHQATIQGIADAAGIAKSGIYFYFKSKEELVYAVFAQYQDRMLKSVIEADVRISAHPKDALIQQILIQFEQLYTHTSIFAILSRGEIDISVEIKEISMTMRTKFFVWFRDQIIGLYGPHIEPHAFDLSVLITSLIREYMGLIVLNNAKLPLRELSETIVARLDDSARGILKNKKVPIVTNEIMKSIFPEAEITEVKNTTRRIYSTVDALIQRSERLSLTVEEQNDILEAADVLKEEANQLKPRRIVLEGMITLLQEKVQGSDWHEIIELKDIILEY